MGATSAKIGPSHCRCRTVCPPVATFDAAFLPEKIAPWVGDISERMQCPPDYVAVAALVALGSVLGRKIGIAPQQQTDWFEVQTYGGVPLGVRADEDRRRLARRSSHSTD